MEVRLPHGDDDLGHEFLSGNEFETKVFDQQGEHHFRFGHGEVLSDTRTRSGRERQQRVRVTSGESRRIEFERFVPVPFGTTEIRSSKFMRWRRTH